MSARNLGSMKLRINLAVFVFNLSINVSGTSSFLLNIAGCSLVSIFSADELVVNVLKVWDILYCHLFVLIRVRTALLNKWVLSHL